MSWFYRHVARPALFTQESEVAHDRTLAALAWAAQSRFLCSLTEAICDVPDLPVQAMGLKFPNPIGLAAGMDKQGLAVPFWRAMGFGFAELGGVTRYPQLGNSKPRMFRITPEEALINRMGFNNGGAAELARRLTDWKKRGLWPSHPVGINLGKSKTTPLTEAAVDYSASFLALRSFADFFVVNVSSPNTPNLRQLQDRNALDEILAAIQAHNCAQSQNPNTSNAVSEECKPLLVKIAPDLSYGALEEVVDVALRRGLAGIVATNTTVSRPETSDSVVARIYRESGGLSGRPLHHRSTEVIRHLYRQAAGRLTIIGVGGVSSAADAWEKVAAGASLVQIYSALVFQGPLIVREMVRGLEERLAGASWNEAVGSQARP